MLDVALLQLNSGPDIADNIILVRDMIRQAAGQGARFVLTPENTCHMVASSEERLRTSPDEAHHPVLPLFSDLAREHGIWILAGSIAVKVAEDKVANRSYLFDDHGEVVAFYDKIHLFDVDLPTGENHRESLSVQSGNHAVIAGTPWGIVGMSICYDLRFAYLYRVLAQKGAKILTVPSAFTVPTGQAHWEVLLRARAIETGSFVLAPAQTGTHAGGRETYGHSLIVNPWGEVVSDAGDSVGIITASLDLSEADRARRAIPSLHHDRPLIFNDKYC